jgi:ATP-dependent DNA helicase 2 subunit 1
VIASNQLAEAAESWIAKLSLKKDSGYPVDSNPNPGNISFHPFILCILNHIILALAYHNLQLEAAAFREEFDPETFEDLTLPNYNAMHKVGVIMGISGIV